jgi:hypothetical protein
VTASVIADAGSVTPRWLDEALRRAGALRRGRVVEVDVERHDATWSTHARLTPRYSADATGDLPSALFLKMCTHAEFGQSEVDYYRRDYVDVPDAPLVRCYDAAFDPVRRGYHLLLDDLSATHTNGWDVPVTSELVAGIADSVAALHAPRMGETKLGDVGARLSDAVALDRYFAHVSRGLEPLLAIGGDDVRPEWRQRLREIFAHHPALMHARARDRAGICLVHGDINSGNLLVPRSSAGRVFVIDRQPFDWSLCVWLGVSDLAYLMCSFWKVDDRRRFEREMLERYLRALSRRGIEGYDWPQLWADYRLCAVQAVYVAVEWCVLEGDRERMRWLWTRELRTAMAAFDDLECGELWAG